VAELPLDVIVVTSYTRLHLGAGKRPRKPEHGERRLNGLLRLSHGIDVLNRWLSRFAVWLVLLAALLSAFNAFFRYSIEWIIHLSRRFQGLALLANILDWYTSNSNAFLEMQWYMFTAMAMLGGAYTLKVNEHVRVDLIYGSVSERTRTWIDLFGGVLCLLPFCFVLMLLTWPWFVDSYRGSEVSTNAGGLIRWPVKLILPVGFFFVLLQGVSEIIKCVAALTTDYVREHAYEKPLQ
jgi:TRAP-type mannitol/chloroaromatic compound transport system permease small subunit